MDHSDEDIDSELTVSLTDDQVKLLALLYIISGTLSVFGSFIIVHRVVRNRELSKSYDRIMLGLSSCDIIASLGYISRPFLLPKETSIRITAIGNDVTCNLLGWMTQFGYAAVVYNAVLSLYMLAVIRYSITQEDFAARFEPYLHALNIFFFLATATLAVPFGIFSELRLGLGCWIVEVPECLETGRQCFGKQIGWIFVGAPLFLTFAILVVSNIMILAFVMNSLRIEGQGRTRAQRIQIRRVATQGFLYVGAFVFTYFPGVTVRLLGAGGHSNEADIYKILILQASLVPLQGFLNMLIYIRPTYLRMRSAGAGRLTAMWGAWFATDIPKFLTEVVASSSAQSSRVQSQDSISDEIVPKGMHPSKQYDNDDQQIPNTSGGTEDADGSGEEFVEEDFVDSEKFVHKDPPAPNSQPSKPILKSNSARINMDGSITLHS